MPTQTRPIKKKKTSSMVYQPRRMVLPATKNKHRPRPIHVLGMSLSRLNISASYKNRIKAMLANNRALAHSLSQAHLEISQLNQVNFELSKKLSPTNAPQQVKTKLHQMCHHLEGMVTLLHGALAACSSEDVASVTIPSQEVLPVPSCSRPTGTNLLGLSQNNCTPNCQNSELFVREGRWLSDMTTIEEQTITGINTEILPPILFTEETSTKQYKKIPSRSKSRSRSEACSRPDTNSEELTHLQSYCSSEDPAILSGSVLHSKPEGQTSQSQSMIPEHYSSHPNRVKGMSSSESQERSFDSDIAVQIDPHILCQLPIYSPDVFQQGLPSSRSAEESLTQKPSLEVGVSVESKMDHSHGSFDAGLPVGSLDGSQRRDMPSTHPASEDDPMGLREKYEYQSAVARLRSYESQLEELDRCVSVDLALEDKKMDTGILTVQEHDSGVASGIHLKDIPLAMDLTSEDEKVIVRVKKPIRKLLELTQSYCEQSDERDPDFVPKTSTRTKSKSPRRSKNAIVPPTPQLKRRKAAAPKTNKKKSIPHDVIASRVAHDLAVGDATVEPNQPLTKSASPKDSNTGLLKSSTKPNLPEQISEAHGSTNSVPVIVPQQASTSSWSGHKKKTSKVEKLSNPITKRISGKTLASGKENLITASPGKSTESNSEGLRSNRHYRKAAVNYKEPSLMKKIRRE